MTERVVDGLETIEIEAKDSESLAAFSMPDRFLQLLMKIDAIGQARQLVVPREIGDARFRLPLFRHVLMNGDPSAIRHCLL
jgi:hypothetical protein